MNENIMKINMKYYNNNNFICFLFYKKFYNKK